jgi:hypothetical protein
MEAFSTRLLQGEKIAWFGRPGQGIILGGRDLILIPFSLMWGGFAIVWEVMEFRNTHTPFFFKLWGVPFILVGLYLIFGRFIFDAYLRRRIDYAVTNRRILISGPKPFASLTMLNLNQLPELRLKEGRNGRGTIYFGPQTTLNRNSFSGWTPSLDQTPKFIDIEDAQAILATIERLGTPT